MSRAIFEGLTNFGNGIAQGMIGRQHLNREDEQRAMLGALLDQENPDIMKVAQYSPEIANLMQKEQNYQKHHTSLEEQKDLVTLGNISVVASSMQDPSEIRSFFKAQIANGGHSEGVLAELADTLNMDDDQMLNDIRLGAKAVSENPDTFGRLVPGEMDGKRVYFQVDKAGNKKIVDGIVPPKSAAELNLEAKLAEAENNKQTDAEVTSFDISSTATKFVDTLRDPEAGSATGLSGMIEGSVGRLTGSKPGVLKARLARYSTALVLQAAEALSGAMSDGDIALLQSTMPADSDDVAIWQDWYENDLIPTLKTSAKRKNVDFAELNIPESIQVDTPTAEPAQAPAQNVIKWGDL